MLPIYSFNISEAKSTQQFVNLKILALGSESHKGKVYEK